MAGTLTVTTEAIRPSGDTTGATDIARINSSLANNRVTRLRGGDFTINRPITQPSNTTLILEEATVRLTAGANCNVWRNASQDPVGDRNISVKGIGRALFDGNGSNQTLQSGYAVINNLGMSAVNVTNLNVEDIQIGPTRFWSAFMQGVTDAYWHDITFEQDRVVNYQDGIDVGPGCSNIHIGHLRGITGDDICAIFGLLYPSAGFGAYPLHPLYQPGTSRSLNISNLHYYDIQVNGPYNIVRTFNDDQMTISGIRIHDARTLSIAITEGLFSTAAPDIYIDAAHQPVVGNVSDVWIDGLGGYCTTPLSLDSHIANLRVANLVPTSTGALVGTREGTFTPTVSDLLIDATSRLGNTAASMQTWRAGTTTTNVKLLVPTVAT